MNEPTASNLVWYLLFADRILRSYCVEDHGTDCRKSISHMLVSPSAAACRQA
ncbi:hypothetical protein N431DRAFT_436011 [Stipitochalara longipes BDJ]|nr:hypothetical protein N431DRAFT_436011 [Stipitochalara longipes BDJ]